MFDCDSFSRPHFSIHSLYTCLHIHRTSVRLCVSVCNLYRYVNLCCVVLRLNLSIWFAFLQSHSFVFRWNSLISEINALKYYLACINIGWSLCSLQLITSTNKHKIRVWLRKLYGFICDGESREWRRFCKLLLYVDLCVGRKHQPETVHTVQLIEPLKIEFGAPFANRQIVKLNQSCAVFACVHVYRCVLYNNKWHSK